MPTHADEIRSIADHIRRFWDPCMRSRFVTEIEHAGIHCDSRVATAPRLLCD